MTVELTNLFDENESYVLERFSTVIIFVFIYYAMSYYFLNKSTEDECLKYPALSKVVALLIFHVVHIVILRQLFEQEKTSMMWLVAILPLFLYLLYRKYEEYNKREAEKKMKEMYAQIKSQYNITTPVGDATTDMTRGVSGPIQSPPMMPPDMQRTQVFTTEQTAMTYQQQMNTPPQLLPQSMKQPIVSTPQLYGSGDAQFDSNFGSVTQNPQPLQTGPLQQTGLDAFFSGYDPYDSNFAMA